MTVLMANCTKSFVPVLSHSALHISLWILTEAQRFSIVPVLSHSALHIILWILTQAEMFIFVLVLSHSTLHISLRILTQAPELQVVYFKLGQSQWPRGLRHRSPAARLLRLWVRIPPGAWMSVCCECCVLSGRGLCDELITRPEESYQLWCVIVCHLETSEMRRPWLTGGRSAKNKQNKIFQINSHPSSNLCCSFGTSVTATALTLLARWPHT